jgi:hypothetical protein
MITLPALEAERNVAVPHTAKLAIASF